MGVVGGDDLAVKGTDLLAHGGDDGHRLRGAQSTVHKVLLHIHNDQKVFHTVSFSLTERRI